MESAMVPRKSFPLRHKLNAACILEVLKFLNIMDLTSLSQLDDEEDPFFTSLISNYFTNKMFVPLDFSCYKNLNYCPAKVILKNFGKSLKQMKITINQSTNFNEIVQMIITHCSTDLIYELKVIVKENGCSRGTHELNRNLLQQAIPYLRGIKHFHMDCRDSENDLTRLAALVINEAKNLETLTLLGAFKNVFQQIVVEETQLKKLFMIGPIDSENDSFIDFIRKLPQLEVFELKTGLRLTQPYGETMAEYCPNLQVFSDTSDGHQFNAYYYNFLQYFKHLKDVTISLYSENIGAFPKINELFNGNSLRKFTVNLDDKDRIDFTDCNQNVSSNKTTMFTDVQFYFKKDGKIEQLKWLLENCQSSMFGIRKISVECGRLAQNIPEILQYTPHIQEVSIYAIPFLYRMPAEVLKIKQTIVQNFKRHRFARSSDKVHFIVTKDQEREFNDPRYRNYFTCSVKTRIDPFN